MTPSWQNLQGLSGATAVGALTFIGLIFVANAFATNLLDAIDFYSRTPTWAIVIAFPAIAVSYLLGLLSMGAAEAMLTWTGVIDAEVLVADHVAVGDRGIARRDVQRREVVAGMVQAHVAAGLHSGHRAAAVGPEGGIGQLLDVALRGGEGHVATGQGVAQPQRGGLAEGPRESEQPEGLVLLAHRQKLRRGREPAVEHEDELVFLALRVQGRGEDAIELDEVIGPFDHRDHDRDEPRVGAGS